MVLRQTTEFFGKNLTIETGRLAKQANGAALVSLGETTVLVTVVAGGPREGADFLPLTVDYLERTYSAGRIPGGYFKREGRPTEVETLNGRLIDRPNRPLFPKGYNLDTQIVAMVLSADKENDPGILGIIGASAALMFSDVPWMGPVAGLRVGYLDGRYIVNPTYEERERCALDLAVAVGPDGLAMVEGEAKEVPEKLLVGALVWAEEVAQPILDLQRTMAAALGRTKRTISAHVPDEALVRRVREVAWDNLCRAMSEPAKMARRRAVAEVFAETEAALSAEFDGRSREVRDVLESLHRERLRRLILDEGRRVDGRGLTDVRPISCELGVLPRTHGSALFARGETQVIVSATLGTAADEQRMDLLTGDVYRSFMLHYNFPPFCVGEIKPMRGPSRRDIGHGNLAARGVNAVLPPKGDDFPYTIRVVSEVLESNGSSSMATVCGSSLALMDAGVPVRCHVGGIAMGLVKEGDRVAVLTDILGDEDHAGDMDFKIVGTEQGVTAVQMDIKCSGLDEKVLTAALEQARQARLFVLSKMKEAIDRPRPSLSPHAPVIFTIRINPDRIRDLIGPGGRNIRGVQTQSGASVEVEDDGTVHIAASDQAVARKAIALIRELTDEAEVGRTYLGQVVKVTDFGAFVRILPGVEGLVHISELADHRVKRVEDVVQEGDEILVKCIHIDKSGKVRLSRREAMEERAPAPAADDADDESHDRPAQRRR